MDPNRLTLAVATSLLTLAACKPAAETAAPPDPSQEAVAIVNGSSITRGLFDFSVKAATNGKAAADLTPEQRNELLDQLIRMELFAQQALKDKLDQDKETAATLAMTRTQVLQQATQRKYREGIKPTDIELRQEYEALSAAAPRTEYSARHILVQTKERAEQLIAQLNRGANFAQLAARESIDGSRSAGGLLDWFPPNAMVKPFADAVMTLKKGEITRAPVQTQFGYHIIKLEDTRERQIPPLEQVKDQVAQSVVAKKLKAYSDELMKTAKIERKL
jgi:peptidyl-prolyl cis-trans isomerase C